MQLFFVIILAKILRKDNVKNFFENDKRFSEIDRLS